MITLSITAYFDILISLGLMSLLSTLYANRLKEYVLKAVSSMNTASRIPFLVSSMYRWCKTSPCSLCSEYFSSLQIPLSLNRYSILPKTILSRCFTEWCQLNSLTNLIRHTSARTWCWHLTTTNTKKSSKR
jgi:hypothetical protein